MAGVLEVSIPAGLFRKWGSLFQGKGRGTMQFIDLAAQQRRIRGDVEARIRTVLDHGQYVMGPEVRELEERLADYVGVRHALSCASGTDALLLALMARGVGPGDAVFTSPFTFMATAEVIALLGAVPVFVDIEPVTFNLDPTCLDRAIMALRSRDASLSPLPAPAFASALRLRGIIAVDLFGVPAEYDAIQAIADQHGLFVIQDGAQSFGAERYGQKSCSMASVGCTSFFPAKPLGAYGDGGMCFTDDAELDARMQSLRIHGQGHDKYDNVRIGINGRLDTMQAAVLLVKFGIFPEEIERRQNVAHRYTELIQRLGVAVDPPRIPDGVISAWAQYSVLARDESHRAGLLSRLKSAAIPAAIYYPRPLHLQTAFKDLGYGPGAFPVSESCAQRIFSLPMHPYLAESEQERVVTALAGD
jgi:dTDP-4-amino-4,6-dideoxygalactose transaminase